MTPGPNVLFIICDDLNDAIEGWGGHPQTRTPNVSRLMQRGMSFLNGHCNASICAPSRASLWSGLYPHTTGNYTFRHWQKNPILNETVMMQRHFRDNGYRVFGTGKLHHNGQEDKSVYDDFGYDASFGPFPYDGIHPESGRGGHPNLSALLDSDEAMPIQWEQTFGPLSLIPTWPADVPTSPDAGWSLYGKPFGYVDDRNRDRMPDELSVDWAIEKLKTASETPFFLGVGFNRPHTPLYVPDEYFERFPLDEIKLPPHMENDFDDTPKVTRALYQYGERRFKLVRNAVPDMWTRWIQAYLACISFVDDQVGLLLDALDASPARDNTIIVFTSDNGYHMGEKNILFKNTLWEEATRVPYIVSVPGIGRPNSICRRAVSLIDLYPTLVDLCRLPPNPNTDGNGFALDGHSLRPLLENPETGNWDGPESALTTMPTNGSGLNRYGPHLGPAHFSHRGDRWRYSLFGNGEEELFDHRTDPQEWTNLSDDETQATNKSALRQKLLAGVPAWLPEATKPDWASQDWEILG